jgi:L-ascorbate metabolism protein UlaG (beta-lactamase superfamily)
MPHIDAVVISHDHYDHLDEGTITAMRGWDTVFIVPLGVGAHLEYWGVPKERIVERDWWDKTTVRGLEIVTTPARHASGRGVLDKDATLWAGYALLGPKNRVYFSGDTGLFSGMKDIGQRLGPFDTTAPGPIGTLARSKPSRPTAGCAARSCCRFTGLWWRLRTTRGRSPPSA